MERANNSSELERLLIDDIANPSELWHIVWKPTEHNHWIFKLLHPHYQHCYAIKRSRGGQYWIVTNPVDSCTLVELEPLSIYPTIRDYTGQLATIMTIKANYSADAPTICFLQLGTCVDVVKRLLGLRAFWIWTPYQLYKRLHNGRHHRIESKEAGKEEREEPTA